MITIAHLSDTHFDGGPRAHERGRRVLDHLTTVSAALDVVLVTGDIADHGHPDEYAEARQLLDLPLPVLVLPGNHDVRAPFGHGLLGRDENDHSEINQLVTVAGTDFLLCDSVIPGHDNGRLSDHTIGWLDRTLTERAETGFPALICFHHPPVALHIPFIDALRQFDEHRLADVILRHPSVVAVLCGHAHTGASTTFADVPVIVAPGVVSTTRLPFEPGSSPDLEQPPAVTFHILDDDRRLVSHVRPIY